MKNVEMRRKIGNRIEAARKIRKMTQAQLAERLSKIIGQPVSERTIGEMERGKRSISAECICALSEALVVPVCNLLNTESGKDADDAPCAAAGFLFHSEQVLLHSYPWQALL